jgi:hypothetical protein
MCMALSASLFLFWLLLYTAKKAVAKTPDHVLKLIFAPPGFTLWLEDEFYVPLEAHRERTLLT